jgi:hypothetical protein
MSFTKQLQDKKEAMASELKTKEQALEEVSKRLCPTRAQLLFIAGAQNAPRAAQEARRDGEKDRDRRQDHRRGQEAEDSDREEARRELALGGTPSFTVL